MIRNIASCILFQLSLSIPSTEYLAIEPKEKFLKKDRNQKILKYLEKGYSYNEISKIVGCSYSTINKVKTIQKEFLP